MASEREARRLRAELERATADAAVRLPIDRYPQIWPGADAPLSPTEDQLLHVRRTDVRISSGALGPIRRPVYDESGLVYGEPLSEGRGAVRKGHR